MDNSGFVSLNFGMNVANSQAQTTSHILQQLPGVQQIFTQNASVKPSGTPQNVIQQTVLPVNNQQQAGNQTVMAAAQTGLQFVGQSAAGFLGQQQQQQQLLAQQAAQQMLGPRGVYTANYQLMPRNYTLVNQGVQGTGVALQLSPQQIGTASIGTATLSPLEQQQQQFIQSPSFDPNMAAMQQNQQQIAFQNANGQLMIQSPTQQLMLQSPSQQFALQSPSQQFTIQNQNQFTVQSPNLTQFNPQQQLLAQGQGNNVIVQGQNGGMILQSENFMPQGLSQNVFMQNPGVVQNVNQQIYGNAQNILANQIPGLLSQAQILSNQNMGIISVNQSPTGASNLDTMAKANTQNNNPSITNQQMQLLAHIANQGGTDLSHNLQNQQNLLNQAQNMANTSPNQTQSLPSFGHFLLHHHMQSLPHPFLQNLALNSVATQQAVVANSRSDQNLRNLIGAASQTATILPNQCVPSTFSSENMQNTTVSDENINAEFNSWNLEQFSNQARPVNINPSALVATKPVKRVDIKPNVSKVCSTKQINVISTSNSISTGVVTTLSNVLSSGSLPVKVCTDDMKRSNILLKVSHDTVSTSLKQGPLVSPQLGADQPSGFEKSCKSESVIVPYGWVRVLEGDSIVYYSPTCTRLTSTESIKQYLVSDETCKCGLECPFHIEHVFNFNSEVISMKWTASSIKDTGNLCNHKRKLSSLNSTGMPTSGLSSRVDVSLVTSSAMMSPRVSSTVQENQSLCQSNKRQKVETLHKPVELKEEVTDSDRKPITDELNDNSSSEDIAIKNSGENIDSTEDNLTQSSLSTMISENVISTGVVDTTTTCKNTGENLIPGTGVEIKIVVKESVQSGSSGEIDKSEESKTVTDKHRVNETNVKQKQAIGDKQLVQGDIGNSSEDITCLTKVINNNNNADKIRTEACSVTVPGSDKITMSNTGTESKTSVINSQQQRKPGAVKTKGQARSRSKSSGSSKLPSELSSPVSERSSLSRCSDRSVSPRQDQVFSTEMFTHLMNFCGVNPSDLPPVFQQNFTRVPDANLLNKSPSVKAGSVQIPTAPKMDRMKLPLLAQSPFGPLQANLLANLHKLSSPPNQQVFPPFNLPGLPGKVQGGYQHGASVNSKGSSQPAAITTCSLEQGSRFPFGPVLPDSTLGGITSQIPEFVWLSPDGKRKTKNITVDKEKMDSLFDSVPPPNVDVSQLEDKGHGPIPKQKIASLLENSPDFEKQHTDLGNSSISSTSSTTGLDNSTENGDQVDAEKTRSDSACSDRLNSPFKPDKSGTEKTSDAVVEINDKINVSTVPSSNILETSPIISGSSTSTHRLSVTVESSSVQNSVVSAIPVASAPPTPTTVVHHTPGSLSCHQMSLLKARQHALGLKESGQDLSKESLLQPLAAILNDPAIGHLFQQMFPEAVQEALMHTLIPQTSKPPTVVTSNSQTAKVTTASVLQNQLATPSLSQLAASNILPGGLNTSQRPSFPIQELLNNLSQGDFPASTLLSAAAKGQLSQPQHPHGTLMGNQVGPMSTAVLHPQTTPLLSQVSRVTGNIQTPLNSSAEKQSQHAVPSVLKSSVGCLATVSTAPSSTEKAKRSGAPKISELLNRNEPNKQSVRPDVQMLNLINHLQRQGQSGQLSFPHIGQTVLAPQHLQNVTSQTAGTIDVHPSVLIPGSVSMTSSGQQASLINQQVLQMYNALGFSTPNSIAHSRQQTSMLETGVNPGTAVTVLNQQQLINAHLQANSQYGCPTTVSSSNVPLLLRQQDSSHSNIVSNVQHFAPLLGNPPGVGHFLNAQGVNVPANLNALLQQSGCGPTQPAVNAHSNILHQFQANPTISVSSDPTQNTLSINNPLAVNSASPAVMNMLNIQHSIGNGTQLTAMQLQTLQLQQQLLQQLQQVQGMQNLISQYNLHNNIAVSDTTSDKKQTNSAVTGGSTENIVTIETSSRNNLNNDPTAVVSSTETVATTSDTSNVGRDNVEADKEVEVAVRKSSTVRVIAAADTTDDCSPKTRTVDIGTVTDAIDEDNSEVQSEVSNEDDQIIDDHSHTDTESGNEVENTNDYPVKEELNSSVPSTPVAFTKAPNLTTCLAIATHKGASRSNELESKLLIEKSSLAKSQNLSAELTKPSGNELKLKIKRKRLLESSVERAIDSVTCKKIKPKEKREPPLHFEKKELRSSTVAATKASSSLAAVTSAGKDANRAKDVQSEAKQETNNKSDIDPRPSCSTESIEKTNDTSKKLRLTTDKAECDSSVDSVKNTNSIQPTCDSQETSKKSNLTSQIAAALSSQKGQWQLAGQKKMMAKSSEQLEEAEPTEGGEENDDDGSTDAVDNQDETCEDSVLDKPSITPRSFSTGDLVWGQIRGFPSWPGKLVDKTDSKCSEDTDGMVYVKWFGDNTVTQVEPNKLKTLSEGLEAHHRARKKHRRGRKMNSNLEQAIQQAMAELDKQALSDSIGNEKMIKQVKVKQKK